MGSQGLHYWSTPPAGSGHRPAGTRSVVGITQFAHFGFTFQLILLAKGRKVKVLG